MWGRFCVAHKKLLWYSESCLTWNWLQKGNKWWKSEGTGKRLRLLMQTLQSCWVSLCLYIWAFVAPSMIICARRVNPCIFWACSGCVWRKFCLTSRPLSQIHPIKLTIKSPRSQIQNGITTIVWLRRRGKSLTDEFMTGPVQTAWQYGCPAQCWELILTFDI